MEGLGQSQVALEKRPTKGALDQYTTTIIIIIIITIVPTYYTSDSDPIVAPPILNPSFQPSTQLRRVQG